ncbi:hypothetical protein B0H10DRAFT_770697 [Mycena sp. CBHHK59/15]|nr:hypothetical protein B0H10DRAFT_770697 [Mycena sp. CBHHK59/15]
MGLDELHLRVLAASSEDYAEKRNAKKDRWRLRGRRALHHRHQSVSLCVPFPAFLSAKRQADYVSVHSCFRSLLLPLPSSNRNPAVIFGEYAMPSLINPFHCPHGRIIPQALSVRYGLSIGAACAPVVLALMFFAPLAWPIAKLLDWAGARRGAYVQESGVEGFLVVSGCGFFAVFLEEGGWGGLRAVV